MSPLPHTLHKMATARCDASDLVLYTLLVGDDAQPLNDQIGQTLTLSFTGNIFCINCQRKTKSSFAQGYCYPCFMKLAATDLCIVKPSLCHHAQGTCRDNDFAMQHCMIPHTVYLAFSSDLKVGITRAHRTWERWADQGALAAVPLCQVQSRRHAGLIEAELAKHLKETTHWQKMLKATQVTINLLEAHQTWQKSIPGAIEHSIEATPSLTTLSYPVSALPPKIVSLNPEKTPTVTGTLLGIKGQYLIFDTGVINIRKYQGYEVNP